MKWTTREIFFGAVLCVGIFFMSVSVFSQGGPGGGRPSGGGPNGGGQPPSPPSASEIVSQMKKNLNLTDDQATQATAIMQEQISEMDSLMKSGSPESNRSKMESIHQQAEAKLAKVLTSEQLTKWENSKPQGPRGGGDRPSGEGNGFGGNNSSGLGEGN